MTSVHEAQRTRRPDTEWSTGDCEARPPTKRQRVLAELLRGPVNRFELEQRARDHVPNSTIADLRRDGVRINSTIVPVPGYGGAVAWVARYELCPESRELALEFMRRSRRAGNASGMS